MEARGNCVDLCFGIREGKDGRTLRRIESRKVSRSSAGSVGGRDCPGTTEKEKSKSVKDQVKGLREKGSYEAHR